MNCVRKCCYPAPQNDSKRVIERLLEGNRRYVRGRLKCFSRRRNFQTNQKPYAAILSCSDSRVIPERIFDTGPGDLFVARVAGNVFNEDIYASFEYALKCLGTRVIIVLGHSGCGAVEAALGKTTCCSGSLNCMPSLISKIKKGIKVGSEPDVAIRDNACHQAGLVTSKHCLKPNGGTIHVYYGVLNSNKSVELVLVNRSE